MAGLLLFFNSMKGKRTPKKRKRKKRGGKRKKKGNKGIKNT
jgi:hypothetical protein